MQMLPKANVGRWWRGALALLVLVASPPLLSRAGAEARLTPPPPILLEQPTLTPTATDCATDYWHPFTNDRGYPAYLTLNTDIPAYSTNHGEWRPNIAVAGYYTVEAYIAYHESIDWCSGDIGPINFDTQDAPYVIHHASGASAVYGDQLPLNNEWLNLGVHPFAVGTDGYVVLSDLNGEPSFSTTISFSAMRFTYAGAVQKAFLPLVMALVPPPPPPPPPSPSVETFVGQAFDKCTPTTLGQLQTWWDNSPYRVANVYIGGVSRAALCYNSNLNASYISAATAQGWKFLPTWVGLQAPCTTFGHRMSGDAAISYAQGRAEADDATAVAQALGFTSGGAGGTIIYQDIENYGSGAPQWCREAVKAFVAGWTERLHELGNQSGVYGGCTSYMTDWASITPAANVPDDVWIAHWYVPRVYNPNASVFGTCVSNALWANHQRVRQYAGDHNETWGGVTFNIDSNVIDGEVAAPGGAPALLAPTGLNPTTPFDRDLFSGQALTAAWAEESWALVGARLYHTANGGLTWQSRASVPLAPDHIATQLQFTDAQQGWLTTQQLTSRNFSLGQLLATDDGGRTWQTRALPAAGQLHVENKNELWLVGGVENTELHHSRDGGQTWQAMNVTSAPAFYSAPVLWGEGMGLLPVTIASGKLPRFEVYGTTDAGLTWTQVFTQALSFSPGAPLAFAVYNRATWAFAAEMLYLTHDGGRTLTSVPLPALGAALQFDATGAVWAQAETGHCVGAKNSAYFVCSQTTGAWHLPAASTTWQAVALPVGK